MQRIDRPNFQVVFQTNVLDNQKNYSLLSGNLMKF